MSTDREEFERGAIARHWSIAPKQSRLRGIHTPHEYHMCGVEMAWQGFQMAREAKKPRADFLALAEENGARITGKPDGSEPIEIVFSIEAWRAFDAAVLAQQGQKNDD